MHHCQDTDSALTFSISGNQDTASLEAKMNHQWKSRIYKFHSFRNKQSLKGINRNHWEVGCFDCLCPDRCELLPHVPYAQLNLVPMWGTSKCRHISWSLVHGLQSCVCKHVCILPGYFITFSNSSRYVQTLFHIRMKTITGIYMFVCKNVSPLLHKWSFQWVK